MMDRKAEQLRRLKTSFPINGWLERESDNWDSDMWYLVKSVMVNHNGQSKLYLSRMGTQPARWFNAECFVLIRMAEVTNDKTTVRYSESA